MRRSRALLALALLGILGAALVGCRRHDPGKLPGPQAQTRREAKSIDWFTGSLDAAFAKANAESKPVLLYWGAAWCPYCKDLQANVFSRPDFIEKSRLFVPVYLDGDHAGAQKAGEEFGIAGYPTVIALRADRTELARIGGGMDRNQYAEVLDLVLSDTKPLNDLLTALVSGNSTLSADDCRRLAFNAWTLDDAIMEDPKRLASRLYKAIDSCPKGLRKEKARLTAIAASAAAIDPTSEQFKQLLQGTRNILADRPLAASVADALQYLDRKFFVAVQRVESGKAAELFQNWNTVMNAIASDERYTPGDRLAAERSKLVAARALDADGKIPPALIDEGKSRVEAALAEKHDEYTRAGLVNAALNILNELGDRERAYKVAEAEMRTSQTPYYSMSDLGSISESLGRKEEALAWFERAYRESTGAATRFQWGASYVNALVRLAPQDEARIRKATLEVLSELDGPDRLYRRSRARLDKLESNLRKWNDRDAHTTTVAAIRKRMDDICVKIPQADSARAACGKFLAKA